MEKVIQPGLYQIVHKQFATDRYEYGTTLVKADSKEEAMSKLNDYLATNPDGVYTAKPCENINFVSPATVLE